MNSWRFDPKLGLRVAGLVLCALALSASLLAGSARAWVPGRNGDIAYTSDEGGTGYFIGSPHVWLISPDGTNKRRLTNGNDAWPAWSPNGRKIVYADQTPEGDTFEWRIWEMNADGSGQVPLTPGGAPGNNPNRGDNMPRFSPDGSKIVFIRTIPAADPRQPPDAQIWLMDADGANRHVLTDLAPTHIYAVGWSPDGQSILFLSDDLSGMCELAGPPRQPCRVFYEISPAGSAPRPLPLRPVNGDPGLGYWDSFDYSPAGLAWGDATGIARSDGRPDGFTIFTAPNSSSRVGTETALPGDAPTWAPDAAASSDLAAASCVFGSGRSEGCRSQLFVGSSIGSSIQQLTYDSSNHYSPSWGPTVRRFALGTHVLSVEVPPQLGRHTLPLLIHCPTNAGHNGCRGVVTVTTGGTDQRTDSVTFRTGGGTDRYLQARIPNGARAGSGLTIRLTLHFRRHKKVSTVRARVLRPARIASSCPAQPVRVGSQVTFSGSLTDSAPAGKQIGVVALAPDGQPILLKTTTSRNGSFAASLNAGAPGVWQVQSVWRGDASHPSTSSGTCPLVVRYPPRVQTQLTISCPQKAFVKQHLQITGAIKPPFAGAQITLRYTQGKASQTSTDVTTAGGTYSDQNVVANAPGQWTVTAFYPGDAFHKASTSRTCTIAVS